MPKSRPPALPALLALFTLLPLPAPAQLHRSGWTVELDGDTSVGSFATSIAIDPLGNPTVLASNATKTGGSLTRDLLVKKFDPLGNPLWESRFDPTGINADDSAHTILADPSGDLYVLSSAPAPNTPRFVVTRLAAATGKPIWSTTIDTGNQQSSPTAAALHPAGGIVAVGGVGRNGREQMIAARFGPDGKVAWQTRLGARNSGDAQAFALAISPQGLIAVTGYSSGEPNTGQDVCTALLDPAGAVRWTTYSPGTQGFGRDFGHAVAFDQAGNVLVAAELYIQGSATSLALLKLDPATGAEQGRYAFLEPRNTAGRPVGLHPLPNGETLLGAELYEINANQTDLAVVRVPALTNAANPKYTWRTLVNPAENPTEIAYAFATDIYGNSYIGGLSTVRNQPGAPLLARVSPAGDLDWLQREAPAAERQRILTGALAVHSPTGHVYAAGSPDGGNSSRARLFVYYQAPTANSDRYTTEKDKPLAREASSGLKANDIFAVYAETTLLNPPTHGTLDLKPNGSFTYNPPPGFTGETTFAYRLAREGLAPSETTVTITVTPPPPPTR